MSNNQQSPTPSVSNLNHNLKALMVWVPRYPNKASSKGSQQTLPAGIGGCQFPFIVHDPEVGNTSTK